MLINYHLLAWFEPEGLTILIFQEIEAVNKTGDHDAMRKFLRDNKILLSIS